MRTSHEQSPWLLYLTLAAATLSAEEKPAYTFGATVVDSSGLQGRVYHLEQGAQRLPRFDRMEPVGSVWTTSLNIWPQSFSEGFPGITERFEWFGIAYSGKIWIETAGDYRFSLLADDGARLKINGKLLINNDGVHRATAISGSATLSRGVHEIEIDYFQGPRFAVALVFAIAGPGEPWRVFRMEDFKPPSDPGEWRKGKISGIRREKVQ